MRAESGSVGDGARGGGRGSLTGAVRPPDRRRKARSGDGSRPPGREVCQGAVEPSGRRAVGGAAPRPEAGARRSRCRSTTPFGSSAFCGNGPNPRAKASGKAVGAAVEVSGVSIRALTAKIGRERWRVGWGRTAEPGLGSQEREGRAGRACHHRAARKSPIRDARDPAGFSRVARDGARSGRPRQRRARRRPSRRPTGTIIVVPSIVVPICRCCERRAHRPNPGGGGRWSRGGAGPVLRSRGGSRRDTRRAGSPPGEPALGSKARGGAATGCGSVGDPTAAAVRVREGGRLVTATEVAGSAIRHRRHAGSARTGRAQRFGAELEGFVLSAFTGGERGDVPIPPS